MYGPDDVQIQVNGNKVYLLLRGEKWLDFGSLGYVDRLRRDLEWAHREAAIHDRLR